MNVPSPQPVSHSHIGNAKFARDLNRCQALGFVSAGPPFFGQRDRRNNASYLQKYSIMMNLLHLMAEEFDFANHLPHC